MIVAIASGKGGTGKTTVASNLAAMMAETRDIALVDLDVEEPNAGLFLKGNVLNIEKKHKFVPVWDKSKCINCGNCQKVCNFNAILHFTDTVMTFPKLCHSCFACAELCPGKALSMEPEEIGTLTHRDVKGMHFIESRLDIGQEMAVPLIAETIKYVEHPDFSEHLKIYDSPPGTSCPVIEATKDSDLVFLVTEPTPFGLHDLTLAVETVRQLNIPFYVIINRDGVGDNRVVEYCKKEDIPIAARIPNKRQIAESYSRGELLYKQYPEVKQELQKIVHIITEEEVK